MPTTYVLKSATSDLGGGSDFNNVISVGTEGDGTLSPSVPGGTSEDNFGFTVAGNPGASGATGNFTVEVNVTVGDTNIQGSVAVARVNSGGTQQAISSFTGEQQMSAGVKTFSLNSVNLGTWASGDRLRVTYRLRNSSAHGNNSITIQTGTTDAEVVAPWTLASEYVKAGSFVSSRVAAGPDVFQPTEAGAGVAALAGAGADVVELAELGAGVLAGFGSGVSELTGVGETYTKAGLAVAGAQA